MKNFTAAASTSDVVYHDTDEAPDQEGLLLLPAHYGIASSVLGPKDAPGRPTREVYASGVLAILLCGFDTWCKTAASIQRPSLKLTREMCRVTICQAFVHRTSSKRLPLKQYASLGGPRRSDGQEKTRYSLMNHSPTHGRRPSNELCDRTRGRYLTHTSSVHFTKRARLQDRAARHKLATKAPFALGKPLLRSPRRH